mgnify:CR=1 FL=1
MKPSQFKQSTVGLLAFAFVAMGTYNSFVVNSDAFMDSQNVRFVKRLDELNGLMTSGRKLADNGEWIKLRNAPKPQHAPVVQDQVVVSNAAPISPAAVSEAAPEKTAQAAIKEELSLELSEVFNAKKYAQAPKAGEFGGSLSSNNGVIESMSVNLPGGESISISVAEMAGNVFEYELEGQTLSGMMYQMDKTSYMVTLTNGPHEGTRLKFIGEPAAEEDFGNNSTEVAENNAPEQVEQLIQAEEAPAEYAAVANDDGTQMAVGSFGNEAAPMEAPVEQTDVAQNEVPAPEGGYGFNFGNDSATF